MKKCFWCYLPDQGGLFKWADKIGQAKADFANEVGCDFIEVRARREPAFDGDEREISENEAEAAGYWITDSW